MQIRRCDSFIFLGCLSGAARNQQRVQAQQVGHVTPLQYGT